MEGADGQHLDCLPVAHTHRHFVLHQVPFILQLYLRVADVSNRTGIKYPSVTSGTRKVNINNMYIKYTFLFHDNLAGFLVLQVLGTVAFPVTLTLAVVAHNTSLETKLGTLSRRGNSFATLLRVDQLPFLASFLKVN